MPEKKIERPKELLSRPSILHLREYEMDNTTVSPNGGITVYYRLEGIKSELLGSRLLLIAGIAVTHENDVYCKRKGVELAMRRFHKEDEVIERTQPKQRYDANGDPLPLREVPPLQAPCDTRLRLVELIDTEAYGIKEAINLKFAPDGAFYFEQERDLVEAAVLSHLENGLFAELNLQSGAIHDDEEGGTLLIQAVGAQQDEDEDDIDDDDEPPARVPAKTRIH